MPAPRSTKSSYRFRNLKPKSRMPSRADLVWLRSQGSATIQIMLLGSSRGQRIHKGPPPSLATSAITFHFLEACFTPHKNAHFVLVGLHSVANLVSQRVIPKTRGRAFPRSLDIVLADRYAPGKRAAVACDPPMVLYFSAVFTPHKDAHFVLVGVLSVGRMVSFRVIRKSYGRAFPRSIGIVWADIYAPGKRAAVACDPRWPCTSRPSSPPIWMYTLFSWRYKVLPDLPQTWWGSA
jgi:hypothetical protein